MPPSLHPRGITVVAIDIGLINFAVVRLTIDHDLKLTVKAIHLLDITYFTCSRRTCNLGHTHTACDWIAHFVREYRSLFTGADVVLIERQPPQGFRSIEQLLFREFRSKAQLVATNTLHAFYHVGHLDYDGRKVAMVREAKRRFGHSPKAGKMLKLQRSHDVADALLIAAWYSQSQGACSLLNERRGRSVHQAWAAAAMSQYRYVPRKRKAEALLGQ